MTIKSTPLQKTHGGSALCFASLSSAQKVSEILFDIGAINMSHTTPFTLTSGLLSPVYIDCRKVIGFLPERQAIIQMAVDHLKTFCDIDKIDYVAGGETAGISYAAWISDMLNKPMLYVRKKPKGFGRLAQIEGGMKDGAHVLLVEDLTTDGGSKIAFANVLRDAGASVADVFSVFFYNIFRETDDLFLNADLRLHSLCTWKDVMDVAYQKRLFDIQTLQSVEMFLKNPDAWRKENS